jgi:hypothetical protein
MPRAPQAPPPGVVRFATPEATPGRWYDVNNIRFRGGQLQPIGGNVAQPNTAVTDIPRDLLTWHDNHHVRWAAFGTDSKLYAYRFDLQTLYDITPTGVGALDPPGALVGYGLADYGASTYGTARDPADIGPQDIAASQGDIWSLATFGELLLVVPTQDGHLYQWSPETPATLPAVVANAPTMNRGVIVTDQRHVVLLGAGGDPRNIAWSDQESLNVWTPDVTNLAGSKFLVTQSYAMTAVKVASGVLIFTANDVHLMSYVGAPYAYGIVQIATGCGPLSLRAVVAIGNQVMWPGLQSFWQYAGSVQPMKCDVQDWFYSLVNRSMIGRVFGSPNPAFSEVWWDWPDEGSTECNRYIAVNYGDVAITPMYSITATQPWTIGMRTRTAGDPSGTMDFPVLGGPLGSGGSLFLHEWGWLDDGTPRAPNGLVYAESGNILLAEGDKRFNVTQLVMDAACPDGTLGYRFFPREQPYDAASETDTGLYTVVQNGLMDMRFSGRSVRMRMEALTDAPFAVGKPRLEMSIGGRR